MKRIRRSRPRRIALHLYRCSITQGELADRSTDIAAKNFARGMAIGYENAANDIADQYGYGRNPLRKEAFDQLNDR